MTLAVAFALLAFTVLTLTFISDRADATSRANTDPTVRTIEIELRVWQRVSDSRQVYLSARAEGGPWASTEQLPMDGTNARGTFRYGDRVVDGETAHIELRVWQRVSNPQRVYLSVRAVGGRWGRPEQVPINQMNARGTFRYGDITLAVPLPPASCQSEVPASSLVSDCEALLAALPTLRGTGNLDWSVDRPITSWDGITIEGGRVTRIDLPAHGLTGSIPEELSALLHLQALNLADNELTGQLPKALEELPRLRAINFAGNDDLTGLLAWNQKVYAPVNPEANVTMTMETIAGVTIEFEGELFSATVHDAFLREFTSVVQYFAERHGLVITQPIKILVIEAYEGYYSGHTISLNEEFVQAVAHEYVHALQDELSGGGRGPRWMEEGGAVYFADLYSHAVGLVPIRESLDRLQNVRVIEESLEDTEWDITADDVEKYALGFLSNRYLMTLVGEEALWDFYRQLASTSSWKVAFEEAFGLPVQKFYEAFEAHRALVLPPLPEIRGVVLGPGGEPAEGILVWSLGYFDDGTFSGWLDLAESDGSFAVAAEGDEIRLRLHHPDCGDVYGYVDSAGNIVPGGLEGRPAARLFEFDGQAELPIGTIQFPLDPESECPDAAAE